jgi:hypothetical protein
VEDILIRSLQWGGDVLWRVAQHDIRRASMTFTDIALDGPRLIWRMPLQCRAIPAELAEQADLAVAQLRSGNGRPVAFTIQSVGAVMLHPGAAPLGVEPGARALAQVCARLTPPSRLVSITAAADTPPLAATLVLPRTAAVRRAAAADWDALRAFVAFSSMFRAVDRALLTSIWGARPTVVSTLLPALAADHRLQQAVHACVLGLASHHFGEPRTRRIAALAFGG